MFKKNKNKKQTSLLSLKRKAPKVPDFTCVSIDNVIEKLEKLVEHKKQLNKKQLKELVNRLEKLRSANESLRESGVYWYKKLKHLLYDKK